MELNTLLQIYWRRRLAVVVGAVVAVLCGLLFGRSVTPVSGVAEVRVVFDTQESALLGADPMGADSLPWRARAGSQLLGTEQLRELMARDAELPAQEIAVTDLELSLPTVPASLARAASEAANAAGKPYLITTHTDDNLPIVAIATAAPDAYRAARLAQAAVHALQDGVSSVTTERTQGLSVRQVGSVESRQLPGSRGRKQAAMLAFALFVLWLAALFVRPALTGIRGTLRETGVVAS